MALGEEAFTRRLAERASRVRVGLQFVGPGSRARHTPESLRRFEATLVVDLHAAAGRYPADPRLRRLVAELRARSERFAEHWDSGTVGRHEAARKTIDHPRAGPLTPDCDVLTVAGSNLRIMVHTAEPGTEDAECLALLTVLGTHTLNS